MSEKQAGKTAFELLVILVAGALSALGLYVFVYPTAFAPSGVDGLVTILHSLTQWNAGLLTFILNAPLLLFAFFTLKRKYVVYTVLYTVASSVILSLLETLSFYQYHTATDRWIPVVFSGIILGIRTGLMLKIGGSSGGVDILCSAIQQKKPHINVETPITLLSLISVVLSFFVYNRDVTCILLSAVQICVSNWTISAVLKSTRNAIEAKIITPNPQEFAEEITKQLKHGATVVPCSGMFTGEEKSMIVTVVNIRQISDLIRMAKAHKNTFVYFTPTSGVWGNFRWRKDEIAK
ncbi:MAG: YitT family protein [Clostridia bacterium]|nr:YitT family protein [Clostridia bacterium]